jgi:hypothetical protein
MAISYFSVKISAGGYPPQQTTNINTNVPPPLSPSVLHRRRAARLPFPMDRATTISNNGSSTAHNIAYENVRSRNE